MDPTERRLSRAEILPGEVASPSNPPTGCKFHPRCMNAFEGCDKTEPDLVEYENRYLACFLYTQSKSDRNDEKNEVNNI